MRKIPGFFVISFFILLILAIVIFGKASLSEASLIANNQCVVMDSGDKINIILTVTDSHIVYNNTDDIIKQSANYTYAIIELPKNGILSTLSGSIITSVPYKISGNTLTYTPNSDSNGKSYIGQDAFIFKVENNLSISLQGLVFIEIGSISNNAINHLVPSYPLDTTLLPKDDSGNPYANDADIEKYVSDYMNMPTDVLQKIITSDGGYGNNGKMKDIAYDMAYLYNKTNNYKYAERAFIILYRFAQVVPTWPLLRRFPVSDVNLAQPLSEVDWGYTFNGGLWGYTKDNGLHWNGTWFHQDLEASVAIPKTYDLIAGWARTNKTPAEYQFIEKNLLRYMVELNLRFNNGQFPFDNMGGNRINGIIAYGNILDPHYIHLVVSWIRRYLDVSYFRDGVWFEGSPSYHMQITNRILSLLNVALKNYNDPSGYIDVIDKTHFYNLDLAVELGDRLNRIKYAMKHLALPLEADPNETDPDNSNKKRCYLFALHDSDSTQRSVDPYNGQYTTIADSSSYCYFGLRHAVLGYNDNMSSNPSPTQVRLHFGGPEGHVHDDCLNLGMWALGAELISETEYRGNRGWNRSTAAHNTVVVNERSQFEKSTDIYTRDGYNDSVDGFINDPNKIENHGNTKHFGNLRLWDPTHPQVQVVEAEGKNAYKDIQHKDIDGTKKLISDVSCYKRTVVLVKTVAPRFYVIDIFRVKGGDTHDWMLHGWLNDDYTLALDENLNKKMNNVSESRFDTSFEPDKTAYPNDSFKIEQEAETDYTWYSEFVTSKNVTLRTLMVGCPGTKVGKALAPSMRRTGQDAWFLDVRRKGDRDSIDNPGDNLFVAVHEAYSNEMNPYIQNVEALYDTTTAKSDSLACIKITLTTGRVDYFACTLDEYPYALHSISDPSKNLDLKFQGRLAHIATNNDGKTPQWVYLLEGRSIAYNNFSLEAQNNDFSYRGNIIDIKRKEKGDAFNGFVTQSSEYLPLGGSLCNKTLLLTLGDGRTEGYTIDHIENTGNADIIYVKEEPGIELRKDVSGGVLAKFVYYPWHGVSGDIEYLISGNVFLDSQGKLETTAPYWLNRVIADNQAVIAFKNKAETITLTGSSSNRTITKYNISKMPNHGVLSAINGSIVTYTPVTGYVGEDSFMFTSMDNYNNESQPATVSITTVDNLPVAGIVTPSFGRTLPGAPVTFTTTYIDSNGYKDIEYGLFLINASINGKNCVYVYYNLNYNKLYLRNDTDTAWLGGFAPGSANIIENSYGKLDCSKTTAAGAGIALTVNWNITFKDAFKGVMAKNLYLIVRDNSGVQSNWAQKGTYYVGLNSSPQAGTVTPSSGRTDTNIPINFTTTCSDPDGWQNIEYGHFLINTGINGKSCVYVYYNQNYNKLYLRNDSDTAWLGGFAPGSSNIIENAYGKLDCSLTTASGLDTILTVNWNITFKDPFAGTIPKNLYLIVRDDSGVQPNWAQKGTCTVTSQISP